MRSFRLPPLLLVVGFLGVVGGAISWLIGFATITSGSMIVIQLAPPIGYGLVGLAWWQWKSAVQAGSAAAIAMRRSSRILSLASVITSFTYLALLHGDLRFRSELPNHGAGFYEPHWNLHLAGYAAAGGGFLIAAVGLWIGSTVSAQPNPTPSESELVDVLP
jgi:hypothetical protein